MPTDATGTPTSLGIRKYNTSADAPSGLGFNGAMDDIDALLVARVSKPVGIVSGEVPVWNGATWVRSSVTNIGPTSLGSGTPDATKFLRGDGAWVAVTGTTYRKTTPKVVNTSVAATDLLNGEITIAANALGATGHLRLTASGDYLQNSGGTTNTWRFQIKLGAATVFDTGSVASALASGASRWPWKIVLEIQNTATGAQVAHVACDVTFGSTNTSGSASFTTGEGRYGPASANAVQIGGSAYNTSAVDTTAAQALVLNVINPSASATVETALTSALVEVI